MHIPDGFLDAKTWGSLAAVSTAMVGLAVSGKTQRYTERDIPLMGVTAAFIFAAQMLNFPVAGGTSGHFMGAMLAAILLGPWAATLVMTTVLIVQAFVFQDGGLLALGVNIFNMGIVAVWSGWFIYQVMNRGSDRWVRLGVFSGAWVSIVLSAAAAALELGLSGTVSLALALPAMVGVHALIGIGEGLITVAVVQFISKVRPDLLATGKREGQLS